MERLIEDLVQEMYKMSLEHLLVLEIKAHLGFVKMLSKQFKGVFNGQKWGNLSIKRIKNYSILNYVPHTKIQKKKNLIGHLPKLLEHHPLFLKIDKQWEIINIFLIFWYELYF